MRIKVRDVSTGDQIEIDVAYDSTVNDIIGNCIAFWKKGEGAFVLSMEQTILRSKMRVSEMAIKGSTVLELLPDPEGG